MITFYPSEIIRDYNSKLLFLSNGSMRFLILYSWFRRRGKCLHTACRSVSRTPHTDRQTDIDMNELTHTHIHTNRHTDRHEHRNTYKLADVTSLLSRKCRYVRLSLSPEITHKEILKNVASFLHSFSLNPPPILFEISTFAKKYDRKQFMVQKRCGVYPKGDAILKWSGFNYPLLYMAFNLSHPVPLI